MRTAKNLCQTLLRHRTLFSPCLRKLSCSSVLKRKGTFTAFTEELPPSIELNKEIFKNDVKDTEFTPQISPDLATLLSPRNKSRILANLVSRLAVNSEAEGVEMLENLYVLKAKTVSEPTAENRQNLITAAQQFPNLSHSSIIDLRKPRTVFDNTKYWKPFAKDVTNIRVFEDIAKILHGARTRDTGQTATDKSYYLTGPLAELEQALIRYTVDTLTKRYGFKMVSVPDLLHPKIIEACGLNVDGNVTNVFKLDPRFYGDQALSGTAEMSLGALFMNKKLDFNGEEKRVQKLAAVSRCYRAESTMGKRESGIYRVHHFTKVEMFAVTPSDLALSNTIHEQMLDIQQRLFDDLGLAYRVLDMHPGDLGAPAARKFDCEALLPGRGHSSSSIGEPFYGEISSTSNCTDYQSRRLNIRDSTSGQFCHTINGTACAVPRMIMAICEQTQLANGCVKLPYKLWPYMPSLENAFDDFLGPRPKSQRPVFRYNKNPTFFADYKSTTSTENDNTVD
jgi:seryl-tRNA synthetase